MMALMKLNRITTEVLRHEITRDTSNRQSADRGGIEILSIGIEEENEISV